MLGKCIREWLQDHPTVAGYVVVAGIFLSKALEIGSQSAGGGYAGP